MIQKTSSSSRCLCHHRRHCSRLETRRQGAIKQETPSVSVLVLVCTTVQELRSAKPLPLTSHNLPSSKSLCRHLQTFSWGSAAWLMADAPSAHSLFFIFYFLYSLFFRLRSSKEFELSKADKPRIRQPMNHSIVCSTVHTQCIRQTATTGPNGQKT